MAEKAELESYRSQAARIRAKTTGWKPITVWYALWAGLAAFGSLAGLVHAEVGSFFLAGVVAALSGLYAKYLYSGGRRRVWFFVF